MNYFFPAGNYWEDKDIRKLRFIPRKIGIKAFIDDSKLDKSKIRSLPSIYNLYKSKATVTEILNETYEDFNDEKIEYFFSDLQQLCHDNKEGDIDEQNTNDMYYSLLKLFGIGKRNNPYKSEPEYTLKFNIGNDNEIVTKPDRVIYERDNKILVIIEESKRRYTKTQEELYPQLISELIGMAFHNIYVTNRGEITDQDVFGILIRSRFFSFWKAKISRKTLMEVQRGQLPPSEETPVFYITDGPKEWGFDITNPKSRKLILLLMNEILNLN